MTFIATDHPGFVVVLDTGMMRKYFLSPQAWAALDKTSIGAQSRLAAAAEFSLDGRGEINKSPMKMEPLITEYLTLRGGGASAPAIPQSVRDAVAALVAAVG